MDDRGSRPRSQDGLGGAGRPIASTEPPFDGLIVVADSPAIIRAGGPWILLGRWAEAGREVLGRAVIVTPDGPLTDADVCSASTRSARSRAQAPAWRRAIPEPAVTTLRDAGHWLRNQGERSADIMRLAPAYERPLVLQYHSLFFDGGIRLAETLGTPAVMLLDALQVWEAQQWGIRRPGWGRRLEERGEIRILERADLIACISDEVAAALHARGLPPERTITTPNRAAPEFFVERDRAALRRAAGISDTDRVIGWVGSFRKFHDLDVLFAAFELVAADDPTATLVLVGDGPERPLAERFAARFGADRVRIMGMVPTVRVPDYVAMFDVGVIPLRPTDEFHYSPLKLHEYMAAGIAVVAPAIGEIEREYASNADLLLYHPGDVVGLRQRIDRALRDPELRSRLAANARAQELHVGSTSAQLTRVLAALEG
jgi:glycosyltransferase involved in cell wall biosynthesis